MNLRLEPRLAAGGEAWHWSVHPLATRPDCCPVFLAPPVWFFQEA